MRWLENTRLWWYTYWDNNVYLAYFVQCTVTFRLVPRLSISFPFKLAPWERGYSDVMMRKCHLEQGH